VVAIDEDDCVTVTVLKVADVLLDVLLAALLVT
jgi:hypothetical protein